MTTTNLPTCLLPNDEENGDAHEHAAETGNAQLAVAQGNELLERALHAIGIQERNYTLEHEKQRERSQEIGQMEHGEPSATHHRVYFLLAGSLRYLKNSPSGLTTSMSPSFPSERSYACRLR